MKKIKLLIGLALVTFSVVGCGKKMTPEEQAAYDAKYKVQYEIEKKNQEEQDELRKKTKNESKELYVVKKSDYGRYFDYTKDAELKDKEIVRIEIENRSTSTKTSSNVFKSINVKIYYKNKEK